MGFTYNQTLDEYRWHSKLDCAGKSETQAGIKPTAS